MKLMVHTALLASVAACLAVGCNKKKEGGEGPTAAQSDARVAGGVAGKGLNAPGNDPSTVTLARQALGCKWTRMGYPLKCSARKAWDGSTFNNRETTLLAMLDDPRVQVRWLAAVALRKHKGSHTYDKAQATRLVAAAERERVNAVAPQLATAVARIKLDTTGLRSRVEAIINSHPLMRMSGMLARFALETNPGLYEFMIGVARSGKRKPVRRAAVSALWTGTPTDRMPDSCKLWATVAGDADRDLSADATNYLFWARETACLEHYDAALGLVAAKAKAGAVKATTLADALGSLLGQSTLKAAHKKKALALAVQLLETKSNSRVVRSRMVNLIGRKHPKAKTILAKFVKDEQALVGAAAKRALARLNAGTK